MRRVIRAAYLGEDAGDLSALENPQAVEEIRQAYSNEWFCIAEKINPFVKSGTKIACLWA